ncbi:MAG: NAD(P)H-hydrate dehydratase [Gemmatimonadales bacterium]|nr:NAD(P)H-hydrate dehydratase [Gemmatimonadales bacterium]NIN10819.1 NAD(P)H-hydrate dehydratase [Gemmatimonadales bacterium]NIN49462.1 NAD(P)H-hydrate dehydratase [Gemmatimonadales bacterium]NIP06926.1 NAD(P)H-hydrate dehydratase [Gemmatimonadales bacterium]NIR01602.1 NAD(P)H-hydrate dehydratase [Gemmatimonadales bacterium]
MPLPVLNASQAAEWDERARVASRIPSRVLMEAAGRAVAQVLARDFPAALCEGVLLVAGHGNNGGDGWVAARALRAGGARVCAVETDHERSADCEANRALALDEGVELLPAGRAWPSVGVAIDALLGTGASGEPRGSIGELAQRVAEYPGPVVAVDGPTGLDLSTGQAWGPCRATVTVTFGGVRRGHLLQRDWCGKVVIADIGFPPSDPSWPVLMVDSEAAALLPAFSASMHKGQRGHVVIIGGAEGMAGAALHAASAAFAAGAGLVKIAASQQTVQAAQAVHPDALTVTTALGPECEPELEEVIDWAHAVVLGPGLGRGEERNRFVAAVLQRAGVPVVVDADALHTGWEALTSGDAPRVFTPHPGEFLDAFHEFAGQLKEDRFAAASAAAAAAGASAASTVLLKGVPTIIAVRDRPLRVVATGNPALATGGSGDLLSGFIAAFLARGIDPRDAAALGAFTLGRAAELAAADLTVRSTRPADVLAAVPELWRMLAVPRPFIPPVLFELPAPALV